MKLLLDTHIWVWSLQEPSRLTTKVTSALTDRDNELWLSPVSVWELLLLIERGRIEVLAPFKPRTWLDEALVRAPLQDAPLTREVAILSREVRVQHGDPADRFLAATACAYDLTLVTADARLLRGKGFRTLANR